MVLKVAAIVVALFIFIFGWREAVLRKRAKAQETAKTEAAVKLQQKQIERLRFGRGGALGYDDV